MRKVSPCNCRFVHGQMLTGKIVITTCLIVLISAVPEKIPIGAIFSPGTDELQTALRYAFHIHNTNDTLARFKVEPVIDYVDSEDPFKIARTLCLQMNRGIFTLVAPTGEASYDTLASYSNTFQVPFISPSFPELSSDRPSLYGLSLRPRYLRAILDVIIYYKWKVIYYLYDTDGGLLKLQHIFRLTTDNYKLEVKVVKRISNASDANAFLHSLETRERESLKYVVLDCNADTARKIIVNHVRDIYMGRRNYHFLLTSLVMDEYLNSQVLEFGAINVTGFRILQPRSPDFRHFVPAWQALDSNRWPGAGTQYISAEAALMYDVAKVILDAYSRLLKRNPDIFRNNFRRGEVYNNGTKGIDCRRAPVLPWEHGERISRIFKKV
ncbi:glutamate receptor 1 [Parasteatoda tepidariorum]|uniref:glutamate receptor 1 n=1 Tax=Parasteatoda tepidariorum TaxID=114398 RepID=UPI0039BCC01B